MSGIQQSDSVTHMYINVLHICVHIYIQLHICIQVHSFSFQLCTYVQKYIFFSIIVYYMILYKIRVLHSSTVLFTYFIYSSLYLLIPNNEF